MQTASIKWWKEAVAYQIYPRSFMDSNGDGIGDLQGIISKLDYLKGLGIGIIWICPVFQSPNDDNGYDISDYQDIMAEFGTMEDFDLLLEEVHARGMKLILDLVINHTSDEHPWFIESRSGKDNPKRDYYIWRDPAADGSEPNNWESIFSGPAWEFDEKSGQYFMHIFSRRQPDLNWENPEVRKELYGMVNWWLDKGIDGFRVDAISHIKKIPGLADMPNPDNLKYVPSFDGHMNREGIHEFLEELKQETFAKYDIVTVGEANGVKVQDAEVWVGEDKGAFNMIFQFEHLGLWNKSVAGGIDLAQLKSTLTRWQKGLEGMGWNALFLENHDQPRSVSTWGDDGVYWKESSKSLATMYFLMQGTPFIYQGQEIGMTNVQFPSIDDYNDVAIKNLYRFETENGMSHDEIMRIIWKTGRDNSRTPMQWSREENGGFTSGTPWLKANPNYSEINVQQAMEDPDSIYHHYKRLIRLRAENLAAVYGTYDLILADHPQIYAYTRTYGDEKLLVLCNLFPVEATGQLPEEYGFRPSELLLANYLTDAEENIAEIVLKPYESRVYKLAGVQGSAGNVDGLKPPAAADGPSSIIETV
ncbi:MULTISPECIES: alpha-glucosidase [unclassified Paenibacillus]|uniref:glycoside hydrolase family 13 protein n=1 Tax=unclassified Paenibacillus TaxID=185978 RepID=UPI0009560252|nr:MULTISPECIES: alpha-glucosidase [unclassified Paenibacillus]ASS68828.1 alpha-glucosidase [Paenibacillus sp. RUD330]SIR18863.1 alpha-glucosidase [Paenibacillus sp. RU4X]SIR20177.1 alpha-glucosidase [Paenibacillus sp. RU4T]